jgi:hypothetical protein
VQNLTALHPTFYHTVEKGATSMANILDECEQIVNQAFEQGKQAPSEPLATARRLAANLSPEDRKAFFVAAAADLLPEQNAELVKVVMSTLTIDQGIRLLRLALQRKLDAE